MQYVYAAMLLHSAKKEVSETGLTHVLKGAGVEADASKVKALVASLKDINIDDAIAKAAVAQVAVAAPSAAHAPAKESKAEAKQDEKKSEEDAAAGLGSLFG
ncbi:MAG: 50S ribosomal protein P1 [Candidatus Diapherotrites archaeon]|nr:50S ribosomal protein P1 [Candidatus Diapherotrites archaeon]